MEIVLDHSLLQKVSITSELLKVVIELGWVNTGLSLEVILVLPNEVNNFYIVGFCVQFFICLLMLFLLISEKFVNVLNLIVVTFIFLVFPNLRFFLYSLHEVDVGAVFLDETIRQF